MFGTSRTRLLENKGFHLNWQSSSMDQTVKFDQGAYAYTLNDINLP